MSGRPFVIINLIAHKMSNQNNDHRPSKKRKFGEIDRNMDEQHQKERDMLFGG